VTELMTNAIKHGRDAAGLVRLSVSCKPIGDGKIEIATQDNGPGLPKHAPPQEGHGLGFRIVERLLAQVDGQIAYHRTQDGLTVCLTVPSAG
jgi:two-component sensor histidine kinase